MIQTFNETKERAEQDGSEHKLAGSTKKCIALIPLEDRLKYLPIGERQNIGQDKKTCASRNGPVEIAETKLNYLYQNNLLPLSHRAFLEDNGYIEDGRVVLADVYIGILSKTTKDGNSLKAPFQALHEHGIVPKKLLPQLNTFEENLDPARLTDEINALGKESLEYFDFSYDQIPKEAFLETLVQDMVALAVHAWERPVNGVYQRTELSFNHVVDGLKPEYLIRDSYPDDFDGDFEKNLTPDFKFFDWGYRLYISLKQKNAPSKTFCDLNWVTDLFCRILLIT